MTTRPGGWWFLIKDRRPRHLAKTPGKPHSINGHILPLLGSGVEADVYLLPDGETVLKQYRAGTEAAAAARREAEFLRLLESAERRNLDGVRFPRLIAEKAESGQIWMELAQGKTLAETASLSEPSELGKLLARAISHYTESVGCAFHDCAPDNLMWNATGKELWMLDVAGSHRAVGPPPAQGRDSVSLGYYLGAATYELARPGRLRLARLLGEVRLVRSAITEFRCSGRAISRLSVGRTAWAQFKFAAFRGSPMRWLFYGGWGVAIACVAIGGALVGPSPASGERGSERH